MDECIIRSNILEAVQIQWNKVGIKSSIRLFNAVNPLRAIMPETNERSQMSPRQFYPGALGALGVWQSKRVSGRVLVRRWFPLIPFIACRLHEYSTEQTGDVIRAYRVLIHAEVIAKCRDGYVRRARSVAKRYNVCTGWKPRSTRYVRKILLLTRRIESEKSRRESWTNSLNARAMQN